MKKLFGSLIVVAIVSLTIFSCKDNFNEEDFLKLQSDLRLKQDSINRARNQAALVAETTAQAASLVKTLNEAGELMGYTLLARENNVPLVGVVVTISTGSDQTIASGRTAAVLTATTGADGNAVFDKVQIGLGTISFSKTGYASASAQVNFGTVPAFTTVSTIVGGTTVLRYLPPAKQFRTDVVQLYAKTGGTSATVKGKIRIQTDLTNATTEAPPVGTIIAGDFSLLAFAPAGNLSNYVFDTGSFGSALTDAAGNYSMTVPATIAGYQLTLVMPTLQLNQTIAVNKVDGVAIPAEYRSTPAMFGPNAGGINNTISTIIGAVANFSTPPVQGAGLNFTIAVRPKGLGSSTWNTSSGADFNPNAGGTQSADFGNPASFDIGETVFQVTNRGSAYTKSPVFTITGGAGTGAVLKASLRGFFSGSTISGGSGYAVGNLIDVIFNLKDTGTPVTTQAIASFTATVLTVSSPGGAITSLTLPTAGAGFSTNWTTSGLSKGFDILNFETVVTTNTGVGTLATGNMATSAEIQHIQLSSTGSGYTSASIIAIDGGALMTIREFRTQWNFTAPTKTVAYSVLPTAVNLEYTGLNFGTTLSANFASNGGNVGIIDALDLVAGDPVFANSGETYRSALYSAAAPKIIESANGSVKAKADVVVNTNGTVGGLTTTGANFNAGDGYNAVPTVTIAPTIATAPGTGAVISVQSGTTFNAQTGEYQWATLNDVLNGGSGYLPNLNQTTTSGSAPINPNVPLVKVGQTYTVDYDYGTGFRIINFN